jgi:lipoate-protein ligase A
MITHVWLDSAFRTAAAQMAMDAALLDLHQQTGHSYLRFYRWSRDTISLGANEAALRSWDRDAITAANIPVVRRPTGGRAVWHAPDDLTYAWGGPSGGLPGVRQTYRYLHEVLGQVLATNGSETTLAAHPVRSPGLQSGACFDLPVGGEVLISGQKVIGSSQLVRGESLLQHGAIVLTDSQQRLSRFRRSGPMVAVPRVGPDLPGASQLAAALELHWLTLGATQSTDNIRIHIESLGQELVDHYDDPAWTWRR